MNILVAGGAGFIGSHVVDAYIDAGHNVVIVDNLSSGKLENLNPCRDDPSGRLYFYKMDIGDAALEDIFKKHNFDIVNNHAAQIDVRKSVADPAFDAETNVIGGIKILELAKKYNVKKIIYSSTGGAIYGEPQYHPCDEAHPVRPLAPYGISKHCLEHYIEYYHDLFGLDYTIFRYGNVYGPRQDPHGEAGVVSIFIGRLLEEKDPFIFGDGKQTRDYVYVGDVARANLKALTTGSKNIINIGTGRELSVNELYEKLTAVMNLNVKAIYKEPRPGEVYRVYLNCARAKEVLGWEAEVSFDEGLKTTVEYFAAKKAAV